MKICLLKIEYGSFENCCSNCDYSSTIYQYIINQISNWTEVNQNEYFEIQKFIDRFNNNKKSNFKYQLITIPEDNSNLIFSCIKDQIQYEENLIKEQNEIKNRYNLEKEKREKEKLNKKMERDRKKLEQLKKQFGE